MRSYLIFAAWSLLAGIGIPLIGVLNSGLARSVGNPFAATAVMFAVAALVAFGLTLPLYGSPTVAQLGTAPPISYGAGLLIGFYVLSATIIIPRFGAASFIAFILAAQILTSAIVDQFGLFGMERRAPCQPQSYASRKSQDPQNTPCVSTFLYTLASRHCGNRRPPPERRNARQSRHRRLQSIEEITVAETCLAVLFAYGWNDQTVLDTIAPA